MSFPSLMSWLGFWVLPGSGEGQNPYLRYVFAAGKLIQLTFPILFVWYFYRESLRPARPHLRGMAAALAFALVVAAGIFVLYFAILKPAGLFEDTGPKIAHWLTEFNANTAATYFTMAFFVSILHSFMEEYYWRWFAFGWLRRHIPLPVAIVLSSLAFMSHHVLVLAYYLPGHFWTAAVPFSLCVAGGGIVWAWLYHRYNNLYAVWLSHLLIDAAIMVVGYDMIAKYW
jgi:membrane protease YdiL (CAAX protease family)